MDETARWSFLSDNQQQAISQQLLLPNCLNDLHPQSGDRAQRLSLRYRHTEPPLPN